mmetsp:Transcript_4472/g.7650  ORF Transcript_4472/g.7650 Transcript_4472/m.7650 type:complete len:1339 (-) Transcript_4472:503-4519(-)|eukprot:CAMPEP_0203746186 /NCGR_PEP_ID=MMETSP0098-20131031/1698_1 /ASSEMBLY_ACC=CAM_ASM_000208 /TAXON_ID=96639 /ORGANISM=" , Strain NY0313808BC1" /LENGTH=1338 /DNA_ID=CAMNT_0050634185 /DNA_START=927 /DNA_END=4943 /DNA_ORIENTATION=-
MQFDPGNIERALAVIYNPSSSSDLRQNAQALCDQFSLRPETSLEGLLLYASTCRENKENTVRLFALNSCLQSIQKNWNAIDEGRKNSIKNTALELLEGGTRDAGVEPKYIKAKVVSIVVELAQREWPQKWSQFLPSLQKIAMKSHSNAELVLMILHDLAEDCTNSDFNTSLPPRRKADILQALRNDLDTLLKLFYTFLETSYVALTSQYGNGAEEKHQTTISSLLATTTLAAVEAFVDFTPVQSVLDHKILQAITEFVKPLQRKVPGAERIQVKAWRCVCACARKTIPDRSTIDKMGWITNLFAPFRAFDQHMPLLRPLIVSQNSAEVVWPTFAVPNDQTSGYNGSEMVGNVEVQTLVGTAVSNMSTSFLKFLIAESDGSRNPQAVGSVSGILQVACRMLCHPSIKVQSAALPAITAIVRVLPLTNSDSANDGERFILENIVLLVRLLADGMIKVGCFETPETALWPTSRFSIEEYEDETEFEAAFITFQRTASSIIRLLVKNRYLEPLQFLRYRIEAVCNSAVQNDLVSPKVEGGFAFCLARGAQSTSTPRDAVVTATLITLVDAIIPVIKNEKSLFASFGSFSSNSLGQNVSSQGAIEMRLCLEAMLKFQPGGSNEWTACVAALSRFSQCYGAPPDGPNIWLGPVLEKLFTGANFCTQEEREKMTSMTAFAQSTLNARRKACAALVEICSQLSSGSASSPEIRTKLASLLPTFCQKVLEVLNDRTVGNQDYERAMLYEVLVLVSNTLDDAVKKAQFLEEIIAQPLSTWCSPFTCEIANDPSKFLEAFRGFPDDSRFVDVKQSLSLLLTIARRSQIRASSGSYVFAPYWKKVLPNIFSMLRTIQQLWENRQSCEDACFMHPEEAVHMMGKTGTYKKRGAGTMTNYGTVPTFTLSNGQGGGAAPAGNQTTRDQLARIHALSHLREGLYSAITCSCRAREGGLYAIPEALAKIPLVVLHNLDSLENVHLARLLSGFFVPYIQTCPSSFWHSNLLPFLGPLLGHTFQRLKISWPLLCGVPRTSANKPAWESRLLVALDLTSDEDNGESANFASCTNFTCGKCQRCEQTEVIRDLSICNLGSSFLEVIGTILATNPNDPAADTRKLVPTPLCLQVLQSDELAAATLLSLSACVSSEDGETGRKAVLIFKRIIFACLLSEPRFHSFLVNKLFSEAFGTLFCPKTTLHESRVQGLLQIVTDIWTFALLNSREIPVDRKIKIDPSSPYRRMVANVLVQGIPALSAADIVQVEEAIAGSTTEKGRRSKIREFIQTCFTEKQPPEMQNSMSFAVGDTKAKSRDIQNLPKTNQMTRRGSRFENGTTWVDAENSWDLGVQALFSENSN